MSIIRNFNDHRNSFLGLSQAVFWLQRYRKVEELIACGSLKGYKMPGYKRMKVKYHELMGANLLFPYQDYSSNEIP